MKQRVNMRFVNCGGGRAEFGWETKTATHLILLTPNPQKRQIVLGVQVTHDALAAGGELGDERGDLLRLDVVERRADHGPFVRRDDDALHPRVRCDPRQRRLDVRVVFVGVFGGERLRVWCGVGRVARRAKEWRCVSCSVRDRVCSPGWSALYWECLPFLSSGLFPSACYYLLF